MTGQPSSPTPSADEPHFQRWLDEIGPIQEMPPEIEVGKPVVVVIALMAGAGVLVAGLGWAAFVLAVNIGAYSPAVLVLLIIGTALIFTGVGFAYLSHRARHRQDPAGRPKQ